MDCSWRVKDPRGGLRKNSKKNRKKLTVPKKLSHSAENESFPIFVHCQTQSARAQNPRTFGSQSESSFTSSESNTLQLRQPIKVEYYVTPVVSQSESTITSPESCITSPESSRLGLKTLLGSRLESVRYGLSYYTGSSSPPPPQLTLLLLITRRRRS